MDVIKKWEPVIGIVASEHSDEDKKFLSEYSEHHSNLDKKTMKILQELDDTKHIDFEAYTTQTFLPLSLRALIELDLEKIEVSIVDIPVNSKIEGNKILDSDGNHIVDIHTIRAKLNCEPLDFIQIDMTTHLENLVMRENVEHIKSLLESATKLDIYKMVEDVSIGREYITITNLIKIS